MGDRLDELFAPYEGQKHLSVRDLVDILGVAEPTVRRWLQMGVIPGYKLGPAWVILTAEVRDWMQEQHNQS